MEKRGQGKIIFITLMILIFVSVILALFFVQIFSNKTNKIIENEFGNYKIIEDNTLDNNIHRLVIEVDKEFDICNIKHHITKAIVYTKKNEMIRLPNDEIERIVKEVTEDEILKINYYENCYIQDYCKYGEVYIAMTKLKEKVVDIFGEFEYKYYVLDKYGNIFEERYDYDEIIGLCKEGEQK